MSWCGDRTVPEAEEAEGPRLGVKEGAGPQLWHLQIEDQVVEAFFRDAVMETYCRNREVMRSRT